MKQFRLSASDRLKREKEIQKLFSEGKSYHVPSMRCLFRIESNSSAPVQFGVGVSKRNFKKATDRNRIKRLIREAYRLQAPILRAFALERGCSLQIFVLYTGRELPDYPFIYQGISKLISYLSGLNTQ
jgi:ribonuclease P protein component